MKKSPLFSSTLKAPSPSSASGQKKSCPFTDRIFERRSRLESARFGIIHKRRRTMATGLAVEPWRIAAMRRSNREPAVFVRRVRRSVISRSDRRDRGRGRWGFRRGNDTRTHQCVSNGPSRSRLRLRNDLQNRRGDCAAIFTRRAVHNLGGFRRQFWRRDVLQRTNHLFDVFRRGEHAWRGHKGRRQTRQHCRCCFCFHVVFG